MKPVYFKGWTIEVAKDQDEYITLPATIDDNNILVSCWDLTFMERIRALFVGRIYAEQMTGGNRMQPQRLSVTNPLTINKG